MKEETGMVRTTVKPFEKGRTLAQGAAHSQRGEDTISKIQFI